MKRQYILKYQAIEVKEWKLAAKTDTPRYKKPKPPCGEEEVGREKQKKVSTPTTLLEQEKSNASP